MRVGEAAMRLLAVVLFLSAVAFAQGDVAAAARANKDQKENQPPPKKVYTNDDLGYGNPSDNKPDRAIDVSKVPRDKQDKARLAARQILQQKQQIARLQEHFDKLQKIQSERANLQTPPQLTRAECSKEPERCEGRRAFASDLDRTQKQLDAAKKKLDDLQDAARKQSFPRSVYDP
ncbi:MAG: hypothetical protein LAN37_02415 [Acidobacteriia bacterium]|nr:hypothetical protein [Terriglobia bacterium]